MATKKKDIKVSDLKPSKDAKGGVARNSNTSMNRGATNQGATRQGATNRNTLSGKTKL